MACFYGDIVASCLMSYNPVVNMFMASANSIGNPTYKVLSVVIHYAGFPLLSGSGAYLGVVRPFHSNSQVGRLKAPKPVGCVGCEDWIGNSPDDQPIWPYSLLYTTTILLSILAILCQSSRSDVYTEQYSYIDISKMDEAKTL